MTVNLKFISDLDFQIKAIRSVTDLFQGALGSRESAEFSQINGNPEIVSLDALNQNLKDVQRRNELEITSIPLLTGDALYDRPNFSVEMETGTGKTYVYLRTVVELFRTYGLKKFVIVVPSVAIREGILETLRITKPHFQKLYDRLPYNFSVFSSDRMSELSSFCRSMGLEIMVITIQSFNKKSINTLYEKGRDDILIADSGMDMLSDTRPVVILDEPQKMGSELSGSAIREMNPLFVLRYSATHKDLDRTNLVYSLGPAEAHELGLVKKIDVIGTTVRYESTLPLIRLTEVRTGSKISARVIMKARTTRGIVEKSFTLTRGDLLQEKTRNGAYEDLMVTNISGLQDDPYIELNGGTRIRLNHSVGDTYIQIAKEQIESTVRAHFETQEKLAVYGVKVLSLFFVDEVTDYQELDPEKSGAREELARIDPEKYLFVRKHFDEVFNRLKKEYGMWKDFEPEQVRGAYFSARKTFRSISQDKEKIDEILKDKEKLLSFESPTSFVFTHSALGEGWDNPNVFNICTLRTTHSEITKRQTIGRGLRIPVTQDGERFEDSSQNVLTVIANESYEDFASSLQDDYTQDGYVSPPVRNRRERVTSRLRQEMFSEKFSELWEKLKLKTDFTSNIDSEKLVSECAEALRDNLVVRRPIVDIRRAEIRLTGEGVRTLERESEPVRPLDLTYEVPDLVARISKETGLTRRTVSLILLNSGKLSESFRNPEEFISRVSEIIVDRRARMEVRNSRYFKTGENYGSRLFESEVTSYRSNMIDAGNSLYDKVLCDTQSEKEFATRISEDNQAEVFTKLPDSYYINTPVGRYRPDWAIIYRRKRLSGEIEKDILLVCETKFGYSGTGGLSSSIPENQENKIFCAKKHYSEVGGISYLLADSYEQMRESIS